MQQLTGLLSATHTWLLSKLIIHGDTPKVFIVWWNWKTRGASQSFEKCTPLHNTWYYHYISGYKVLYKGKVVNKILSFFACLKVEYCRRNNKKCLSWVVATRNWENGENIPDPPLYWKLSLLDCTEGLKGSVIWI